MASSLDCASSSACLDKDDKVEGAAANTVCSKNGPKKSDMDIVALENVVKSKDFLQSTVAEFNEWTLTTAAEMNKAQACSKDIEKLLKCFGHDIDMMHVGSGMYAGEGSSVDLDYAFDISLTKLDEATFLNSFERLLTSKKFDRVFQVVSRVPPRRVLIERLEVVHKKTGKRIFLQINDPQDSVMNYPMLFYGTFKQNHWCMPVLRFVRCWMKGIQKVSNANEQLSLPFNTYIISVLVVFYFQVNHELGTIYDLLTDLKKTVKKSARVAGKLHLSKTLVGFFHFYGHCYQPQKHVISVNIGKWQERQVDSRRKRLTGAQKRLRDGMKENPKLWADCGMFVEDPLNPKVNITAEISQEMAMNFKRLCIAMHTLLAENEDSLYKLIDIPCLAMDAMCGAMAAMGLDYSPWCCRLPNSFWYLIILSAFLLFVSRRAF